MSDINIKRKKGESFEAMFRRFTRRFQQSGKGLTVRANRYHAKKATKNKQHGSKLRGMEIADKREWMIKTGKLVEDARGANKRR
ncbi:hypothetical protein CO057_02965 [Candidatus Uhrbacteria bacterium CG_4_9_14_0_2_um_filter_41_50]|uniref:30S ribosomal protein S21 n=1 Tax=Candidatus Uhrbacteria bacterium CG_4_9_14_0_2_um_filter_41_50 TaxID=1975031 RepID=A0A2M8ENS3_9BACT|nr:MAG: hypothetical protein COZ45_00815 [Candidatus Uhrbacteria bacterium CG_4_10_14_3_um_filter_41_21]PIZ54815.1 MAG: hypothetical protein COY24_02505 [Candidatus Uhrbacteria bacterium CG_4_10_14_0_2_um_filter_41_21]PJB84604.1 MAG: hypothetical protein CO086_02755 [Candidatus Uhrbacteria bacterium CG_4_9_14_0_8_um_filter_41_16]PJC24404.1 MAG: hypothetical protein CO057_02965 [Candidatus Uhrbacteria bacterium CG_4_9_14_0_2_um_filter_41_50]PJE75161.1 MAG: hypothetical protein COV03_01640 [Candi